MNHNYFFLIVSNFDFFFLMVYFLKSQFKLL